MIYYDTVYRVFVKGLPMPFIFGAPNAEAAKFYTEMCGYQVERVE